MLSIINLVVFAWASCWTLLAVKKLADGNRHSIIFVMVVFYAFYIIPLLLDCLLGIPAYTRYPGYHLACHDESTGLLYCAYVSCIPPFWYLTAASSGRSAGQGTLLLSDRGRATIARLRPVFVLLLIAPAVLVIMSPNRADYLEYARHVRQGVVLSSTDFHTMISASSLLCVLGASGLIIAARRVTPATFLAMLPFLLLACWVNGKRHIVAYALGLILFALWQRGTLKGLGLMLAGVAAVLTILLFSLYYQTLVRGLQVAGSSWAYDNVRVDFGRDDALKLALFAELHPNRAQVLEFRGQSLLFYATFFLPRGSFPGKPWPHGIYLTAGALGLRSPIPQGWTVPTGWFDESIANLGWAGLVFGPLLFTIICRLGDRSRGEMTHILTIVVGSLLQVIQPWASSPIVMLWLLSVLRSRRASRRPARVAAASGGLA